MEADTRELQSKAPSPARGTGAQGRPYAWMHKSELRKIRKAFDSTTFLDQALAVYTVHCELASNAQSSSYEETRRTIAALAGVSVRRVSYIHKQFQALNVLDWEQQQIEGTKELGENRYTLLMSCTPCPRLGTEEKPGNCTVVELTNEESIERLNATTDKPETGPDTPALTVHRLSAPFEKDLMGRLRKIFSPSEMTIWGGDWLKNWIREMPKQFEEELSEVESKIREGKPIRNPASYLKKMLKLRRTVDQNPKMTPHN